MYLLFPWKGSEPNVFIADQNKLYIKKKKKNPKQNLTTPSPLWLRKPAGTSHVHVRMHFLLAGKAQSASSLTPQSFHAGWESDGLQPIYRLASVWLQQAVSDGSGKQETEKSHKHEVDRSQQNNHSQRLVPSTSA